MVGRRDQGAAVWAVVLAMLTLLLSPAAHGLDGDDDPAVIRRRLVAACDALVDRAEVTPYGWAWTGSMKTAARAPARGPRGARVVTFDTRATAAAGLVLHVAGKRLGEPRYAQAAAQAARALAAVQSNTGQVPRVGVVRANAAGRDEPLQVPSRSATCSALGLLLALAHDARDDNSRPELPRRSAMKAAGWLASQQSKFGGWLVSEPPHAPPGQGTRVVRLDGPEYRDAAVALQLAANVLDDERLARKAAASVDDLDALRLPDERGTGWRLWATAYTADQDLLTTIPALAPAADTVASRNAMHVLLAATLLGEGEATTPMLREAAAALEKLPRDHGAWRRRYDLKARTEVPAPAHAAPLAGAAEPPVSPLFGSGGAETDTGHPSGVDEVVRAVARLEAQGPQRFRDAAGATLSIEDRLALLLCGLGDEFLTEESPPAEAAAPTDDFHAMLRHTALLAWRAKGS